VAEMVNLHLIMNYDYSGLPPADFRACHPAFVLLFIFYFGFSPNNSNSLFPFCRCERSSAEL